MGRPRASASLNDGPSSALPAVAPSRTSASGRTASSSARSHGRHARTSQRRGRLVDAPLAALLELEVLHDVRDVDAGTVEVGVVQRLVELAPRRAHERVALPVLAVAGLLADEHDPRLPRALAEHRLRRRRMEVAAAAVAARASRNAPRLVLSGRNGVASPVSAMPRGATRTGRPEACGRRPTGRSARRPGCAARAARCPASHMIAPAGNRRLPPASQRSSISPRSTTTSASCQSCSRNGRVSPGASVTPRSRNRAGSGPSRNVSRSGSGSLPTSRRTPGAPGTHRSCRSRGERRRANVLRAARVHGGEGGHDDRVELRARVARELARALLASLSAGRRARSLVSASNASQTNTIRAPSGISSPASPSG